MRGWGLISSPQSAVGSPQTTYWRVPLCGLWTADSNELLFDDANRPWGGAEEVERRDLRDGGAEPVLGALVHDHHQAGVGAEAALDDALDREPVAAEDVGDARQHARPIGDLEVEVEGRDGVADDL